MDTTVVDNTQESVIIDGSVPSVTSTEEVVNTLVYINYEQVANCPVMEESATNDDGAVAKEQTGSANVEGENSEGVVVIEESCSVKDEGVIADDCDVDDGTVRFTIVEGASQRCRHKLVDSEGYCYTHKRNHTDGSVTWRCTNRDKAINCRTLVRQRKDSFILNKKHSHPGNPGQKLKWSVVTDIKRKASQEIFTPLSDIVKQTLLEYVNDGPFSVLPSETALQRQASRFRIASQKPDDPTDLKFILATHAIPEGFLRADVIRAQQRHLIFASEEQLEILARAKRWYIDVTSKMVKMPFTQLVTIHCFVQKDNDIKQVPLCFIVMSHNLKNDYVAVFEMVKRILPRKILLQECVLHFDKGMWQAMAHVFPSVTACGCSYLWTQAVWQKIQDVGLSKAYLDKKKTHSRLRKLMALPYMPCEIIPEIFEHLFQKVDTKKKMLLEVFNYVNSTWIAGNTIWPPRVWSVYTQSVRTTADVEGWYNAINLKERKTKIPLYTLIKSLHDELSLTGATTRVIKEEKLMKFQRKRYKNLHGQMHSYWNQFSSGRRSAENLLNACSHLYG